MTDLSKDTTTAAARHAAVEAAYGDPWDRANPTGFAALLEADDRAQLPRAATELYHSLNLNAEYVPAPLGGRLEQIDTLGLMLRPLFRRDATLAVGEALTSLMGAMAVWLVGDAEQQRRTARMLLDGGRATVAYQEFRHGNDFVADEFRARRTADGSLLLGGRKAAVNNADRAGLMLAYARTVGPQDPADGYSLLLLEPDALPAEACERLPRYRTEGAQGLQISGLRFQDCPAPADVLLGDWGDGIALGLRALQVNYAVVPSMILGMADTGLRTAIRFVAGGSAHRGPVKLSGSARGAIAGALVDLLACDSIALAATRALHVLPEECSVLAAAAKYLVPKIVGETFYRLSALLGDAFHTRSGEHAIFQKHVRDLTMVNFGHVSSAICQSTIAPFLPGLLAHDWPAELAAPAELFRTDGALPPLSSERLAVFGGRDGLIGWIARCRQERQPAPPGDPDAPLLRLLSDQLDLLDAELSEIREGCPALDGPDGRFVTDTSAFPLTDRYALLLVACACLGVWRCADPGSFPARPGWLVAALDRLLRRLGHLGPRVPGAVEAELAAEALRRARGAVGFDLYALELAG
ncbi:acyl-CoA dehydrogenase [Kitasatospora sp. NPDC092948]|uniref:acyl-CoA dehydrogenase n=1 Tax=Kitasatospora sp. NPDC092948 TaxID=3364088 RepID=UPI00381520C9